MRSIALFDFDGTITHKDAFLYFLTFAVNRFSLILGFAVLSPVIFLYLTKILSNSRAKEIVLSYFFSGMPAEKFQKICEDFNNQIIPGLLKEEAMRKLNWHKSQGHEVVVVSANFEHLLKVWCAQQQIKLISTCVEIKDGKVTGKFSGGNCYGEEKVNRINQQFALKEFKEIYAYGDSKGDMPMLQLAHHPFYRSF